MAIEEMQDSLRFAPKTKTQRNWPMASDKYPMTKYHRTPMKHGCKQYCDRSFCLSQLCLTRLLKKSYYPSTRVVSAPVSQSDIHQVLKLKKVRLYLMIYKQN